jgi:hypothetical protein
MADLGIKGSLRVNGAAVAFTNEPTTKQAGTTLPNSVFQVTSPVRRIIDPRLAVTVEVDADGAGAGGYVAADPSTYVVDWHFGKVTFLTDQGASALVRVSGSYLPMLAIAEVREMDCEVTLELKDRTTCDDAASMARRFLGGKLSAAGNATVLDSLHTDLDAGAGEVKLYDVLTGKAAAYLEYQPLSTGDYFRGWVLFDTAKSTVPFDDLITRSLSWKSTSIASNNQTEAASFSWGQ